jgi:hypothetical protein
VTGRGAAVNLVRGLGDGGQAGGWPKAAVHDEAPMEEAADGKLVVATQTSGH